MTKPYVYVLIDPRKQSKVFYVGKGKGARTTHHIKETRQELSSLATDSKRDVDDALTNLNAFDLTDKKAQIAELLEQKYKEEDICRVVAILDTEEEAFACESLLIHFVYGLKNLSNIKDGHKSTRFRPHMHWNLLESLDFPLIFTDERKNRQVNLDDKLTELEDCGLVSIINQITNEFEGDWDQWAIRGADDVSRQLMTLGPEGHKYIIKLWGKTVGDGYICIEMRGNRQAMKRLRNDFDMDHLIRRDDCFYPIEFGSRGKRTKEVKELKRRLRILTSIAQAPTIQMLNPEANSFLKSLNK